MYLCSFSGLVFVNSGLVSYLVLVQESVITELALQEEKVEVGLRSPVPAESCCM